MKVLESKIFDIINSILFVIQSKTDKIKRDSFILSHIDLLIFIGISLTLIISTFMQTEMIGVFSLIVPFLVFIKVLITKGERIELGKANLFLLLYFFICLISNFTSSLIPQSLYGFMKTSIYFAFYFALCQFLKTNKKYIIMLLVLLAILVSVESFIAILQNIRGVENISTWQDTSYVNPEDVISRVYGTLKPYNPNLFAGWLVAAFSSLIGVFALLFNKIKLKSMLKKGLCIASMIALLASILTIFLTGSRGAYIALFFAILLIIAASFQVVFYNETYAYLKNIWTKIIIAFCSLSAMFFALKHDILLRIMSIFIMRGDSSTSFRMNVYSSSLQMFQDNWIQGIGVGNKVFREIYGLYMLSGFDALSCYCVFLEMAVESGIFALFAFFLFLIILFKNAIETFIKHNDMNTKIFILVAFISVFGVMIHGLFDTVFFRPQVQFVFWTMTAILLTLTREEIKEK